MNTVVSQKHEKVQIADQVAERIEKLIVQIVAIGDNQYRWVIECQHNFPGVKHH